MTQETYLEGIITTDREGTLRLFLDSARESVELQPILYSLVQDKFVKPVGLFALASLNPNELYQRAFRGENIIRKRDYVFGLFSSQQELRNQYLEGIKQRAEEHRYFFGNLVGKRCKIKLEDN